MTIQPETSRARITYAYVRLAAALPAAWLLLTLAWALFVGHIVRDSMSDYYGTPVRDVFVGALMACGVCMIAYKGQSWLEDYALNFAGLNAFFVALVANSFQDNLDAAKIVQQRPVVSSAEMLDSLRVAVLLFLVSVIVFAIAGRRLVRGAEWPRWSDQTKLARVLLFVSFLGEAVLLVIVVKMLVSEENILGFSVFSSVHFVAAFLLIGNLSFAAAAHAFGSLHVKGKDPIERLGLTPEKKRRRRRYFRAVVVAMWIGLVAGFGLWWIFEWVYTILAVEAWEIVLFLCFWLRATHEERTVPTTRLLR